MVRLRLLGGVAVEREDGTALTGRAVQRHRLALLALLAAAPPSGLGREKLLGLLWPESAPERARNLLNVAVYELRKALGEDTLRSAGDELRMDRRLVRVDLAEFEAALAAGEHEAAVAAYGGPLLDGFFVPDAPEFERWAERERARLAGAYGRALEALGDVATRRGDAPAAVEWSRRRAVHDPYDSRAALRLMQALEAAGDRAGALRHARVHAELLRQEFATEPDPAIAAFAEGLRTAPSAPATAAPEADPSPAAPTRAEVAAVDRSPPRSSGRRRWRVAVAAVALATLAVGWVRGVSRDRDPAPAARSLAVLPFANMSADTRNDYFSDGLSEQIITTLSHVEGLRVAARTSSFALRDARLDARTIGDTLGVEALLEGSVRREGTRLRVTAQLIDAGTGYHIWSGEFDRESADVIAVQEEIARAIADALELRLPPREPAGRAPDVPDLAAYDLYLRALHLRNGLDADDLARALVLLDRALEREPRFALAWAAKASVIAPRVYFRQVPYAEGVREMRVAVDRALALDPTLGEAQVALGMLGLFYDWEWDAAGRALRRAVQLNPSDPHAWHHLANYLNVVGRRADAAEARARSVALDPLNARTRAVLAGDYAGLGRREEAQRQYDRARALDPMHPLLLGLGPALPMATYLPPRPGRPDEMLEELLHVAALRGATPAELGAMRAGLAAGGMPGFWRAWLAMEQRQRGARMDPLHVAGVWALIGDRGRALEWLERAHAERAPGLIYLAGDVLFASLRGEPRMQRVLAAMRLRAADDPGRAAP